MKTQSKVLNPRNRIYTPSSSTTSFINYSGSRQILEVQFKETGNMYHYFHVPEDVWKEYKKEIMTGRSSGKFYNRKIKPVYEFEEIDA
ncbi:MAG TPA: KTSC domain-containing protein [Chitinophagaceae bacterium]|jgi:hypothetical protein